MARTVARKAFTLEMKFPLGQGELDDVEETHPLVSPFKRAVNTGEETGSWLYLLANLPDGGAPLVIGTVVWTVGQRFLFFPGGKRKEVWSDPANQDLSGRSVDHLTLKLDSGMKSFDQHVTVLGPGETHGRRQSGRICEGYMHPWFTLLLNDFFNYSLLPRVFRFKFEIPATDVDRRLKAMMGSEGHQCFTPIPKAAGNALTFFQIDVWAARGKDWKTRSSCVLPLALKNELVEDAAIAEEFPEAKHQLTLHEEAGIVAIFSRPRGRLRMPFLLHARIKL